MPSILTPVPSRTTQSKLQLIDSLLTKSVRLNAMLAMTCCDASESFNHIGEDLRDSYLFMCSELAIEINALADTLADGGSHV
jgi:hypothetical protein